MFAALEKVYDPSRIEPRWAERWETSGWFHAAASSPRPAWSLVIPPPNVTGALHLGHMLEHTEIDAIVRWRRMSGDNALWLPGADHAGIATQMVVERELRRQGQDRRQMGREAFIEKAWEWKRQSGGTIRRQMVRLGASCDWSRERFTLDPGLSRAVREVFVTLYEEGLVYRGRYMVNWCPGCQTALSDLEVVHEETTGHLYLVRYPLAGAPGDAITVATTRPETMLGDVAVAVHPRDERYRAWIGRSVQLPLTGREIPVIADELAQPEFGTGAVKVTPAHDANDFAAGERHHLPQIEVLDAAGRMNENAGAYAGLDRFDARRRMVADLEVQGLLAGVREHPMALGHCQRCHSVVEPRLSTQWFVKIAPLAADAIAAVEPGCITFTPANYRGIYLDWMANIHDWCISRQLWWGHRIPAWHCRDHGCIIVSREDPAQCPNCGGPLEQDPDVLDTWFSSALWPFSTLGWPDQTPDLATFYPTSLLITGFDILFFWVARMIMMGVHFLRRDGRSLAAAAPFRQVFNPGLGRDAEKQKLSKTKGPVIDPMVVTERYGTDAVRFTLAAMAAPGGDIALAEARMEGYRAFANKIWNAARFIFLSLERAEAEFGWRRPPLPAQAVMRAQGPDLAGRWIFSRLNGLAERVNSSLAAFRFHDAADGLYHFFWHEFCDWYLELAKLSLNTRQLGDAPSASGRPLPAVEAQPQRPAGASRIGRLSRRDDAAARATADDLFYSLDAALRLLHPLMPFITEELWQTLAGEHPPTPTLALAAFPAAGVLEPEAEREMSVVQEVVNQVRRLRAEHQVPPKALLPLRVEGRDGARTATFRAQAALIAALAKVALTLEAVPAAAGRGHVSTPDFDLLLELPVSDAGTERERLDKEIAGLRGALAGLEARLADAQFMQRAPEHIRQAQERKREEYTRQLERLAATRATLD